MFRQHLVGRTWSATNHTHLPQAVSSCRQRLRDPSVNRHPTTLYRSHSCIHVCAPVQTYLHSPLYIYILCVYCTKFIYNSILYNHDCPSQCLTHCCLCMARLQLHVQSILVGWGACFSMSLTMEWWLWLN